jgi:protein-disulfide isomerase
MTKKRGKASSKKRAAGKKQSPPIMAIGGALLAITVIAIFFLSRPPAAADVPQERLSLDPVYGNPDALVSIIEYGAYSCHSCQSLHQSGLLEQIVAEYDGQVNLIFRDFPYITPAYDQATAEVAQCVLDQSNTAFWHFHDVLYTVYYMTSTQDELVTIAGNEIGGVDEATLRECVDGNTHIRTVQYDGNQGRQLGLRGTPSLFVGDQRIFSPSAQAIRQAINAELAAIGS